MQTQTETITRPNEGPRRYRDSENAIHLHALKHAGDELVDLHIKHHHAGQAFADAVKAVAEKSGLLPAVIRKYVKAQAGDKYDEAKREVEQLALVFEEAGE